LFENVIIFGKFSKIIISYTWSESPFHTLKFHPSNLKQP